MAAEQLVLCCHQLSRLHFCVRRGKVSMPEQRHLFNQRISRIEQAIRPPSAQVGYVAGVIRHRTKRGVS
jgi:hypothetical protein